MCSANYRGEVSGYHNFYDQCPILCKDIINICRWYFKKSMHLGDCLETPHENSMLHYYQPGHHPLFIQYFCIPIHLVLAIHAPRWGSSSICAGLYAQGAGANSELVISSEEAWWLWPSELVAPWEMKPEVVDAFDQDDWTILMQKQIRSMMVSRARFRPGQRTGHCALLIRLRGRDYTGNHLSGGTPSELCNWCWGCVTRRDVS